MKFEDFTDLIDEELENREGVPADRSYTVTKRNNGVSNNVLVLRNESSYISPSIHLDYYYQEYLMGRDIQSICDDICEIYFNQPEFDKAKINISWDAVKDHIYYMLVNIEKNEEFLERVPHIVILDLALIFKIDTFYLGIDGSITIDSRLQSVFNKSIGEIFKCAISNSPIIKPLKFSLLAESIGEVRDEMSEEERDAIPNLYLLTSEDSAFGAATIFYDEFTIRALEEFGGDMYVIPSSVNELILVPYGDDVSRNRLDEMIGEVNETPYVSEIEYLSHRAYTYMELMEAYREALAKYGQN